MNVTIVSPVFNDWESARQLVVHLGKLTLPGCARLQIVLVDDGSPESPPNFSTSDGPSAIHSLAMLRLTTNLGHQRAIALGIAVVAEQRRDDLIVVMDCDGEDDPQDVPRLIAAYRDHPDCVVVADRVRRSEGATFRIGYVLYQFVFRVLVGRPIRFGNFCAFNGATARRLAMSFHVWNHLAASILRSGLKIHRVATRRSRRYAGKPSTNVVSLISHGLSALAVFSEQVFTRLLLVAAFLGLVAVVGAVCVVVAKLFTNLAIPGWATNAGGIFAIILLQAFLLLLISAVQLLAARSQVAAIPAQLVRVFVQDQQEIAIHPKSPGR